MLKSILTTVLAVLIFSSTLITSQGKYGLIGKLYTQEEAEKLYGPAFSSVEFDAVELISILDKCENYMMFTIKNNEVIITDDYRKILTNHRYQLASLNGLLNANDAGIIDDEEPLNVFSKERVKELIETTGSKKIYFEIRENVMTMKTESDDPSTPIILELSAICPPFC
ncbi:MAG: hypothetical protein PVH88_07680 [Ignavibacteria bacterium]|jgi:hypothetical protein